MSGFTATWSRALGSATLAGMLAAGSLTACQGAPPDDLFASNTTGQGACTAGGCHPIVDAAVGVGTGGGSIDSTPIPNAATTAGGGGAPANGGAGGQGAGGAPIAAGGSSAAAAGGAGGGGESGTTGDAGSGGLGAGGTEGNVSSDAGQTGGDPFPNDAGPLDDVREDVVAQDACVPSEEVCDGLDDNCNNAVDEHACPTGCTGVSFRGGGYMLCYGADRHLSWQDAEMECEARGMHLVRVDDAEENAFIRRAATNVGFNGSIWLGGSDLATEGTWVWTDGTQFWMGKANGVRVGGNYANWNVAQPDALTSTEDCTEMAQGAATWHDVACALLQAFVCEK